LNAKQRSYEKVTVETLKGIFLAPVYFQKIVVEPDLEYGYVKMCRNRKTTHVEYKGKMRKQCKILKTINFNLELIFEETNSHWKGLEEKKPSINPEIGLVHFYYS
jgi:hypothetical protein